MCNAKNYYLVANINICFKCMRVCMCLCLHLNDMSKLSKHIIECIKHCFNVSLIDILLFYDIHQT